jgi:glycosyltransferase involved in cell wall biosynthesis
MAEKPKIALVHDWLTGMRGGEKVLEAICEIFPQADLYTLVHTPGRVSPLIENRKIYTSFLQKLPGIHGTYRYYLPWMPKAIERFDFSGYDAMISTSHCVAKGARPSRYAKHWSYCHTPMRYIWDQYDEYFGQGRSNVIARAAMRMFRPSLQKWDVDTASRVSTFIANSENVRERIQRIYDRDATVIYPPVDYNFYSDRSPLLDGETSPFYLMVSALVPYKRVDLAIHAFNHLKKQLLIIGDGPEYGRLRALAGANIHFSGWLPPEQLRWHYARCQALLFPGEEDFGIVPLEAMAAGRPVVAYRKGGALETVVEGKTGLFFNHQTPEDLLAAMEHLESTHFYPDEIRQHAKRFSRTRFIEQLRQTFVEVLP